MEKDSETSNEINEIMCFLSGEIKEKRQDCESVHS
jgi:hypothetical protein